MYEYSWVNFCEGKELKKKVRIVSELTVLKICSKHFYCGKIMNGLKSALNGT